MALKIDPDDSTLKQAEVQVALPSLPTGLSNFAVGLDLPLPIRGQLVSRLTSWSRSRPKPKPLGQESVSFGAFVRLLPPLLALTPSCLRAGPIDRARAGLFTWSAPKYDQPVSGPPDGHSEEEGKQPYYQYA